MLRLATLLFDLDGVLIDVSESYRAATRATTQFYFEHLLGPVPLHDDLVGRADIAALKLAGGFNNDWDLTVALVKYFLSLIDAPPRAAPALVRQTDCIDYLRAAGKPIFTTVADLARRKDLGEFARQIAANGGGLAATQKILGNQNDHLLFADGDLRATHLIKRIFEEIYLDEELFQQAYGEPRRFIQAAGLIQREKLIPRRETLYALSRRVALGIATGRPRQQAEFALAAAGIADLFRAVVTLEEINLEEDDYFAANGARVSFSKPHPFSLLQAARAVGGEHARCAYVGDTPDDIRAANAAKRAMDFVSIGCLAVAEDKELLRREFARAGADVVIEHPAELVEMIAKKT